VAQPLRVGLERLAHRAELAGLPMAHGDDVVVTEEDEQLAELDHLGRVDVARGLQHEQQHVVEDLELRALMGLDRVLDGERVKLELALERVELLLGRLVQADPDEGVLLAAPVVRVLEVNLAVEALSLLVDRAVDDHEPGLSRRRRARPSASSRVVTSPA
jgi:hypothetical protein